MTARNDTTKLLLIAEKLLALAEAQSETELDRTRHTYRFRREHFEQLDRIEAQVTKLRAGTGNDASLGDAWAKAKKWALPISTALLTAAHVLRTVFHF